jgi:uncharacterized membrane protein
LENRARRGQNAAAMAPIQKHLRNTFLTGIFAALPIAVTVFVIVYVENATRAPVERLLGFRVPYFVGVVGAVVLIYLLGLLVNSLLGRWMIGLVDRILLRVPVLKELYRAWKHISVTPGGKEGIFGKVVLIPVENGRARTLGFSSGEPIEGDPNTCCVFVPAVPNPMNGRLYFLPMSDVQVLDLSAEEAFKVILSGGNYVPAELARGTSPVVPASTT